ncbi:hypothetical protein AVEN_50664-1 [Araneus ventricosus]|uniref:Uncharacterized protein n=1 Tax=Araneus ventricosus TaxID=182803 RepID=A0A4Y2JL67_ARAVE|nr:hypothetical protein AVEN_50664-1 [Araneus ventricosus]
MLKQPVEMDIHQQSNPFHLAQRPVCFLPIQVDRFRWVIHGGAIDCFDPPPTPPPVRLIPTHTPPPPYGRFSLLERAPPLPALISPV